MRDAEKLSIEYVGFKEPNTVDELELEVLGLELAIKQAEQRIALLKQGMKFAVMRQKNAQAEQEKTKNE